jgi:hypothetical protein
MASYERSLNQSTLIHCLHEGLVAALIMVNIAQMNSVYGRQHDSHEISVTYDFIRSRQ